jgi:putative FmdB family regulatory protein
MGAQSATVASARGWRYACAVTPDEQGCEVPTYDFRCRSCGEQFEVVCSIAEREERAVCPACGERDAAQVFGPIATSGRGAPFNPGYFERPSGRGAKPRYVEPKT